jgi:hypothetical protein
MFQSMWTQLDLFEVITNEISTLSAAMKNEARRRIYVQKHMQGLM